MIHVVATLVARPGERDFVLGPFQDMRPRVLEENGCLEYNPVTDVEDAEPAIGPDAFIVIEKWQSLDALNAHNEGLVLGAFLNKIRPHLVSIKVQVMQPALPEK